MKPAVCWKTEDQDDVQYYAYYTWIIAPAVSVVVADIAAGGSGREPESDLTIFARCHTIAHCGESSIFDTTDAVE